MTQVFLQVAICLTGNFGFFNILTAVLCLTALDDRLLPRWLHSLSHKQHHLTNSDIRIHIPTPLRRVCLTMLILMHLGTIVGQAPYTIPALEPVLESATALRPIRSLNSYGLFANMTEERPEIIVEGSYDGVRWKPYQFAWKPGPLDEAPTWATPHMPRLDWQMWFAALQGDCRKAPWYILFLQKLLEGNQPTLELLGDNPFEGQPPRYIRSTLYQYRFTNQIERASRDNYWHRILPRAFCPTVELIDGQLQRVGYELKLPVHPLRQAAR